MTTKQHLTHLESTGLLRLAQTHPELEYLFRHALVQDAAYESLLLADREKLHLKVGETIEQTYPDKVASRELASTLAYHFALAQDDTRALKYFTLAGDADADVYANAEAVEHYTHALEIARRIETGSEKLIYLYTRLGRSLELNAQFDQALETYEEMGLLAQQRSDRSMELASMMARLPLYATPTPLHDPVRAETFGEQALALAQELNDRTAEANILWNLLNLYQYSGRLQQATDHGERSLALARKLNLREQMAYTLNDLGMCYWIDCRLDRAKESLREASSLWRELDNLPMLTDSLCLSCIVRLFAGEYEQAIAFSTEAFHISQTINNLWGQAFSGNCVSRAYWECGQWNRAIASAEDALRLGEGGFGPMFACADLTAIYGSLGATKRGLEAAELALTAAEEQFPVYRSFVLAMLAQLHLLNDNLAEAEVTVDKAQNDPNREGHPMFFQYVILADAELALKQDEYERTLAVTEGLLDNLRHFGIRMHVPSALYLQGQALLALSQDEAARERLLEARAEAETIGSRRMLWQILAALVNIETDPTEAETLRRQARGIIDYIADHTPADLRASFLNLPNVRAVMGEKP